MVKYIGNNDSLLCTRFSRSFCSALSIAPMKNWLTILFESPVAYLPLHFQIEHVSENKRVFDFIHDMSYTTDQ